jgi:hypothetical protein
MPFTDYHQATRAEIEARYPAVEVHTYEALLALKRYFKAMAPLGGPPAMCQGKATLAGAYWVNGSVVYFFRLDEPIGAVTGYVLQDDEFQAPAAVREDVLQALWMVEIPKNGGGKNAKAV